MSKQKQFTEYKFDLAAIDKVIAQKQENLKKNRGLSDFLGFGVSVMDRRLKDNPRCYLRFGPYWWAMKSLLKKHGYDYGAQGDPIIEKNYCGENDTQTLVMADEFFHMYMRTWFEGTRDFYLDGDNPEEVYTLIDQDMDAL